MVAILHPTVILTVSTAKWRLGGIALIPMGTT
jgi:hypothetical protein